MQIREGEILDAKILKKISDEFAIAKVKENDIIIQTNKKIPETDTNIKLFVHTVDHKNKRIFANIFKKEDIIQQVIRIFELPLNEITKEIVNLFIKFKVPLIKRDIEWIINNLKKADDLKLLFALKLKSNNYQFIEKMISYFKFNLELIRGIAIEKISKEGIKEYITKMGIDYENMILKGKITQLKNTLKFDLFNKKQDETVLQLIKNIEYQNIRSLPPFYYYFRLPIYNEKEYATAETEIFFEEECFTISICLNLKNLKQIKIISVINKNEKKLNISFLVEDKKIKNYINKNIEKLNSVLSSLGYKNNILNVNIFEQFVENRGSFLKSIDYWA